ncbi:hypothetical protein IKE67_01940 [bacterium]|nr:hypothetical protein [bacterium]
MQNKSIMKVNKTACACLVVFAIITINRIIHHIPFGDEAHAWTLAEQLNYWDMVNEVKNEGHLFIWHTLLYPFAHSHIIPYPYPMQAINWVFCFLAMILLWWKAPFNNCIKLLITFSFPFLGCYGVLARCYSVGIFLLFLLAILFDKKLKYPKTYAVLLILCANTSIMAVIGATAFGILFLIDLIKDTTLDKKNKVITLSILSFGVIIVLAQLLNIGYFAEVASNRRPHVSIKLFRNTFVVNNLYANVLLLFGFAVPIFKYLLKFRSSFFFLVFVYSLLLALLTSFYPGEFWHSYFFYVYLIIAFWICDSHTETGKLKTIAYVALSLISIILIFHGPINKDYFWVYKAPNARIFMSVVENDDNLKYAQIIQNDGNIAELAPYNYNKTYKVRTHCYSKINSEYNYLSGYNKLCAVKSTLEQAKRYPDTVRAIVDDNTYTYMNTKEYITDKNLYIVPADNYSIYFKKYKCYDRYCFWKVEIKNEE